MHTPTRFIRDLPLWFTLSPIEAVGVGLYLLTLLGEISVGAFTRWIVVWIAAALVSMLVDLPLSSSMLAWFAAFASVVWSVAAVFVSGLGFWWRRRQGAREPTSVEVEEYDSVLELLRDFDSSLRTPARWFVLDDPRPLAASLGSTLVLSRGIFEVGCLVPVLAHELGHIGSLDSRLTEALNRLSLWDDPFAPPVNPSGPSQHQDGPAVALILGSIRWGLRFAGGTTMLRLLQGPWAAYWRRREHDADAYAAALGQAEELASHLAEQEQIFDAPVPHVFLNPASHPPVALRIDRLRAYMADGVGGSNF